MLTHLLGRNRKRERSRQETERPYVFNSHQENRPGRYSKFLEILSHMISHGRILYNIISIKKEGMWKKLPKDLWKNQILNLMMKKISTSPEQKRVEQGSQVQSLNLTEAQSRSWQMLLIKKKPSIKSDDTCNKKMISFYTKLIDLSKRSD